MSQLQLENSIVLVVDLQPNFLKAIYRSEEILARAKFLSACAKVLEVPILSTTQYCSRMGGTDEGLLEYLPDAGYDKMGFSCCKSAEFHHKLQQSNRKQCILVGIETHICVCQTSLDLLSSGYQIYLAADALSSRTIEAHEIGLTRLRDEGAKVCHTESVVYEWLGSADHPRFREILPLVKQFA